MTKKPEPQPDGKNIRLSIERLEESAQVFRALGHEDRLRIVRLLEAGSMNVQQLAQAAGLPVSTAASHVRMLEDAGILMSESVPAAHGAMKLCSRRADFVFMRLMEEHQTGESVVRLEMPLGSYSRVQDIQPTCGLATTRSAVGEYDNPSSFYLPGRVDAQILWFRQGFVEYKFGMLSMKNVRITALELSFEACSEAPMHRSPWKSDISLFINERKVGQWTSPADLGQRRGQLNPSWWPEVMTQYGYLTTWRVDQKGSYVDSARVSGVTLEDLDLPGHDCITVRIGVEEDAVHVGGINLFGSQFGDFTQAIVLDIHYQVD